MIVSVNFSALRLLPCLRSRRRGRRCWRHPWLLSFRRQFGLAAVFCFSPGGNLLVVRWLVHQGALTLANKRKLRVLPVPIDANKVAQMYLLGSQQIGQGIDHVPLNGSF